MKALALEREIYSATSPSTHNEAVLAKCEVRKQQGLYKEALDELSRLYTYALSPEQMEHYYTQKALCGYLASDYALSLATIAEARFYVADNPLRDLVEALAAGEKGEWGRSLEATKRHLATLPDGAERTLCAEELFEDTPHLRNPKTAYWLSLVPGVGQFYAGEVWSGVVSLVANGLLGGFAVSEALAGQWLSGWIVGCGGLSTTYFVGQERARILTERRNARLLREYNDSLREILLAPTVNFQPSTIPSR